MNANGLELRALQVAITGVNIVKFLDMEEGFCAGARDAQRATMVHPLRIAAGSIPSLILSCAVVTSKCLSRREMLDFKC